MWNERLFAILWLLCLLSVAWLTPPLMAPDEPAHLMRADQLSQGELVGKVFDGGAGGVIDGSIGRLFLVFLDYQKAGAPPVPNEAYQAARRVRWLGEPWQADFRNTAQYGPLPYLPQAAGLGIGRLFGLSLLDSYYLARGLAMAAALALGAWALRLSSWIGPLGRIVLLMPMSLFLTASASQDGILIALGLLAAAIAGRAIERDEAPSPILYAVAALAVATLAMARLPYATLALLFLLKPMRGRRAAAALVCVVLAVAAWQWAIADLRAAASFPGPDKVVDSHRQFDGLLAEPARAWGVAAATLGDEGMRDFYLHSIIGNLGWLTLPLALWAYDWALWAFCGVWLSRCLAARHTRPLDMLLIWLAVGLAVGGIFLGLYLTWTSVGASIVEGVQGRYFLPLLGFLPLLLPAWPALRGRVASGVGWLALLAALPSAYAMVQTLGAAYR